MSLLVRLEALYRRLSYFPEAHVGEGGAHLKPDAYAAFLDLRKMIEGEIIPTLYRLEREQSSSFPTPAEPETVAECEPPTAPPASPVNVSLGAALGRKTKG